MSYNYENDRKVQYSPSSGKSGGLPVPQKGTALLTTETERGFALQKPSLVGYNPKKNGAVVVSRPIQYPVQFTFDGDIGGSSDEEITAEDYIRIAKRAEDEGYQKGYDKAKAEEKEDATVSKKSTKASKKAAAKAAEAEAVAPVAVAKAKKEKKETFKVKKSGVSAAAIVAILAILVTAAALVLGFERFELDKDNAHIGKFTAVKYEADADGEYVYDYNTPLDLSLDLIEEIGDTSPDFDSSDIGGTFKAYGEWLKDNAPDAVKKYEFWLSIGYICGSVMLALALFCALFSLKGKGVNKGFLVFSILAFLLIGGITLGIYFVVVNGVFLYGAAIFGGLALLVLLIGIFGYARKRVYIKELETAELRRIRAEEAERAAALASAEPPPPSWAGLV